MQKNWVKIGIFLGLLIVCIGIFTFVQKRPEIEISSFNPERDKAFLLNSFKKDYYWLVENPDFSVDFMLQHTSPNKDPQYFGKLNIKVLLKNDKPIGFMTYFLKKFYEGKIQFIYVDSDHRGKGYAGMLTNYAINDLFNKGATIVKLDTRTSNAPAIKVYERLGFKKTTTDEIRGIVSFELRKPDFK